MKNYREFIKESHDSGAESLWVYEGNFIVTGKMVNNGEMIKDRIPDIVKGSFTCTYLGLKTLKNCPKEVTEDFNCANNYLKDLEYSPKKVGKKFVCESNRLTTLKGCTKEVEDFYCGNNELTSLKFGPEKCMGYYNCTYNKLTNLKFLPENIGGELNCSNNLLTSLEYGPKRVGFNMMKFVAYGIVHDDNKYPLDIEAKFIIDEGYIDNYYPNLFQYCKEEGINISKVKYWPEEFVERLSIEDQQLIKSGKGISKFGL